MGVIDLIMRIFDGAIDAEAELQIKTEEDPIRHFKLKEKLRKQYLEKLRYLLCEVPEE